MKSNLIHKPLTLLILLLASCSNDDDPSNNCTQIDWIGTYSLIQDPDCEMTLDNGVLVVEAGNSTNELNVELTNFASPLVAGFSDIQFSGCALNYLSSMTTPNVQLDLLLNGDHISVSLLIYSQDSEDEFLCCWNGTRQ
ncbi:MAG: hypothetical protein AAFY36_10690 [Bacteroidota bacterium]